MKFSEFWCNLIIFFTYNKKMFELFGTEDGKDLLPKCKNVKINKDVLNENGRKAFLQTETNSPVVKAYEIVDDQFRKQCLGIHPKPNYNYQFRFQDGCTCGVSFDKLKIYFFDTGNAFLSIETSASNIESNHALELNWGLAFIPEEPYKALECRKLSYIDKRWDKDNGKREESEKQFTVKELIDRFFKWYKEKTEFNPVPKDRIFAHSITGVLLPDLPENEKISKFMEARCRNLKSDRQALGDRKEYKNYQISTFRQSDYIRWETCRESLVFCGNLSEEDSDKERKFLEEFKYRLFQHYTYLYLYYLDLYIETDNAEKECKDIGENLKKMEASEIQCLAGRLNKLQERMKNLCEKESHDHIRILFLEHLCRESFKLQDSIRMLQEKYMPLLNTKQRHNIFISYRRKGGVYLALLISKQLTQMGKNVFFDMESLHSGEFDKQLYEKIDQCSNVIAVISPGSMERCVESEDDWVRKELAYAFKKGKNVIPIFMEDFEGFPEDLPEEIEAVKTRQGIEMYARYFDGAMEQLLQYLN